MRKIEHQIKQAILIGENFKRGKDCVIHSADKPWVSVILHGHTIANIDTDKYIYTISFCGWPTVTTKSRLNAVLPLGYIIRQQNYNMVLYYGSKYLILLDPDKYYCIDAKTNKVKEI